MLYPQLGEQLGEDKKQRRLNMAQTATTGNLENAQKIIIAASRYTEEHNAPAMALIESFTLPKGSKQVTVPKV